MADRGAKQGAGKAGAGSARPIEAYHEDALRLAPAAFAARHGNAFLIGTAPASDVRETTTTQLQLEGVDREPSAHTASLATVVYPLTDEPWGVRRFFLRDPNGVVVNVMNHRRAAAGEPQSLTLHDAWGGGTTIGACLRQFLHLHGERLLGRDTVVIIASDGLDVGDPRLIRDAMARLSRLSTAVVWLNPLLETPGYEPTALGMTAARPYVTTFMSVKDPADLARLARVMRIK